MRCQNGVQGAFGTFGTPAHAFEPLRQRLREAARDLGFASTVERLAEEDRRRQELVRGFSGVQALRDLAKVPTFDPGQIEVSLPKYEVPTVRGSLPPPSILPHQHPPSEVVVRLPGKDSGFFKNPLVVGITSAVVGSLVTLVLIKPGWVWARLAKFGQLLSNLLG